MKRSSRSRKSKPQSTGSELNHNQSGCEPLLGDATCKWQIAKIISGGQTGVDRAALDAAIEMGIPHGGWCPRGRRSENGIIPTRYHLKEIEGIEYSERTRRNIIESDATLILTSGPLQGGTLLSFNLCKKLSRPVLVVQLTLQPLIHSNSSHSDAVLVPIHSTNADSTVPSHPQKLPEWLAKFRVRVLNVAGPRASKSPEIYQLSKAYLLANLGTKEANPSS